MRAAYSVIRAARAVSKPVHLRYASTLLKMPAMSPTMTEGGIAGWKVKEGDKYAAGDVILEVETDKATIDVEAQDDGVMGKIIFQAGSKNVPVGETIAVLAEEGDDLAKITVPEDLSPEKRDVPKEDAKKEEAPAKEAPAAAETKAEAPKPAKEAPREAEIDHSKPMFPSVVRLLHEFHLPQETLDKIKPTGKHGMMTKGDILVAMGKIANPYGSAEKLVTDPVGPSGKRASEPKSASARAAPAAEPPLDGPALRRLIVQGLSKASAPIPTAGATTDAEFDDLLADYAPLLAKPAPAPAPASAPKDDLAGLF